MHKGILVLLILAFSAMSADARHRWHRYHGFVPYSYVFRHNDEIGRPEPYRSERSLEVTPPLASSRDSTGGVMPPDWKKQSLDAASNGGRFVSPDGSASFDFYTTAAADQPITEHMKSFAFGEGDEITSLAGERAWIASSGFK